MVIALERVLEDLPNGCVIRAEMWFHPGWDFGFCKPFSDLLTSEIDVDVILES